MVLGLLHLALLPEAGTDLAAQLARASFAREAPLTPVDLSWYSGVHPYGYSLLAPAVMAVVGVRLTGVLCAVAVAVLFARLTKESERPLRVAFLGGVFAVANSLSGRTTFALGAVAALAALLLLPRRPWASVAAVLTALLSPVAAAFLGLIAAVLVLHRRPGGWTLGLACAVPVVTLAILFPGGGVQPFDAAVAVPTAVVALALLIMTADPLVRSGSALYLVAVLVLAVTDDPFGSNIQRLGALTAVALLLATSRRGPTLVLAVSVSLLGWQLDPVRDDLRFGPGPPLGALTRQLVALDSQRVEVVAARDHRESFEVAAQVPLARGWSRQLDVRDNSLFYEGTLGPQEYVGWLADHAVDHVAVPRDTVLDYGSTREAALLRGRVAGLEEVWSDRDWVVYAVADATPIADTVVVSSGRTSLVLRAQQAGLVQVRLRWSRWLSLAGPGCLERDGDEVRVRFARAGDVTVGSSLRPRGHC